MTIDSNQKKVAVVGGGFYGIYSAIYLAKAGLKVTVFEKQSHLMEKASKLNQARVHGGYHYPRALGTAARSRNLYDRFIKEFADSIYKDFNSYYGIAEDSKTSPTKFRRAMELIGAPYVEVPNQEAFLNKNITTTFKVEEVAFNSETIKEILQSQLESLSIEIRTNCDVKVVFEPTGKFEKVTLNINNCSSEEYDLVVLATYGALSSNLSIRESQPLTFEVCELIEIKPSDSAKHLALTIMDGPYWSLTPWPVMHSHVLTHVRHTPHARFNEYEKAANYIEESATSRSDLIIRDVSRYTNVLIDSEVIKSHYVVKTILSKSERDDARPILAERAKRIVSILGSKIDNVYDIEAELSKILGEL